MNRSHSIRFMLVLLICGVLACTPEYEVTLRGNNVTHFDSVTVYETPKGSVYVMTWEEGKAYMCLPTLSDGRVWAEVHVIEGVPYIKKGGKVLFEECEVLVRDKNGLKVGVERPKSAFWEVRKAL